MAEFGLFPKFDTADPAFAYGFECGMIWGELRECQHGDVTCAGHSHTLHVVNAEMIMRMGEATEHAVCGQSVEGHENEWLEVEFDASGR